MSMLVGRRPVRRPFGSRRPRLRPIRVTAAVVRSAVAHAFLPKGESFDDAASAWHVDPHDWADHNESDRLIADHRRRWPEIDGAVPKVFAA